MQEIQLKDIFNLVLGVQDRLDTMQNDITTLINNQQRHSLRPKADSKSS